MLYIVKYWTFDYSGEIYASREFDNENKAQIFASAVNGVIEKMEVQ